MRLSSDEIRALHEDGIKNSRFFIRGTGARRVVTPRYCDDIQLENMADDTEVVCLDSDGWDTPFMYRKSQGVVYEMYRYKDTPYIVQNMLADIEPSEVRVLNGDLCTMLFRGIGGGLIYYKNSIKDLWITYNRVHIYSTPDNCVIKEIGTIHYPDRSSLNGKYIIPVKVISPLLKELRASRNRSKFKILEDLIRERFDFDSRFI